MPWHRERSEVNQEPVNGAFPLREARALVRDLMTPKPLIYWADFLFHIILGWAAFAAALGAQPASAWQISFCVIAGFSLYRAAIFIHELAHLKKGTFRLFRFAWNVLCGIPLLIPSFTYDGVHINHHKRDVYGTKTDGEYLPFATRKPIGMIGYVFLSFLLPLLFAGRFLVLTPLSYLIPSLRKVIWRRASSLTIDLAFQRPEEAVRNDQHWRLQEFATWLFVTAVAASVALGFLTDRVVVLWYVISVFIFFLNSLRTLAAHAYRNPGDRRLDIAEQYLDSIDVPGNLFITALWAPVGLRYHATHHLFPNLPYHNLGKAQRRLHQELSGRSYCRTTLRSSLGAALWHIWREARCANGR
jgi:fatty acid desaturase